MVGDGGGLLMVVMVMFFCVIRLWSLCEMLIIVVLVQYSDNYYRAALIEAIAATVTPAITTVSVTGSVTSQSY